MKPNPLNPKSSIPSVIVSVIVITLLSIYVIINIRTSSYPSLTPRYLSSDSQMSIVWKKQIASGLCDIVSDNNFVYTCSIDNVILALDKNDGSIVWQNNLFTDEAVRALLVDGPMLIMISTTNACAFNTSNGNYLWSVKLGDGHVGIMAQLDGEELRVYYGENIFEINPSTGQITRTIPKNSILWITNNAEIHQEYAQKSTNLVAFDHTSGFELWTSSGPVFQAVEGLSPSSLDLDNLIVYSGPNVCNLDVSNGKYNWCTPGSYISNIAIDDTKSLGYILNDNFSLSSLDLRTGKILKNIQFLPDKLPDTLRDRGFEYSISISGDIKIIEFGDSLQIFGIKNK